MADSTNVDEMQLATIGEAHNTAMLSMPTEDFASLHIQPLQDDAWIRTAEIVHMEDLVSSEGGERIKREILKDYIEEKERHGTCRADPILEGMLYQEQFMEAYRRDAHDDDATKALSYRQRLMEDHRRARAIKNAEE